ncbi:hypothetical protein AKJ36_00885 [candidate division MSBL1 archaeon SCGC-AAA259I07]|uniref:Uncharacterized protein n=1 Tax=candidate division MSBL1 archaeon SCGC-AAA259I07 TaxID=1698266 RepID=A0A133UMK8_9EURY|nr:hypothetical protein AKJ36_00885 [candidate division MSBL1 archaeon SCGC-AAA259I07]
MRKTGISPRSVKLESNGQIAQCDKLESTCEFHKLDKIQKGLEFPNQLEEGGEFHHFSKLEDPRTGGQIAHHIQNYHAVVILIMTKGVQIEHLLLVH